jgi:hypothetical protein
MCVFLATDYIYGLDQLKNNNYRFRPALLYTLEVAGLLVLGPYTCAEGFACIFAQLPIYLPAPTYEHDWGEWGGREVQGAMPSISNHHLPRLTCFLYGSLPQGADSSPTTAPLVCAGTTSPKQNIGGSGAQHARPGQTPATCTCTSAHAHSHAHTRTHSHPRAHTHMLERRAHAVTTCQYSKPALLVMVLVQGSDEHHDQPG